VRAGPRGWVGRSDARPSLPGRREEVTVAVTRPGRPAAGDGELASASRALVAALDTIESAAARRPGVDVLAEAMPGCVRVTGLVAALAGRLGQLAEALADAPAADPRGPGPPAGDMMADIAADLTTMRSLLHRATLVAAPTLADLRRVQRREPAGP
jgi:hypothetical protein